MNDSLVQLAHEKEFLEAKLETARDEYARKMAEMDQEENELEQLIESLARARLE